MPRRLDIIYQDDWEDFTPFEGANAVIGHKSLNTLLGPRYQWFTFRDVVMVYTIEEYDILIYFPEDVHKEYFHQRTKNILEELAKILWINQMNKYREKNYGGLRWKRLEELLIAKKFDPNARMEKCRILILRIFRLELYPFTIGIISLEETNLFIEYKNTKINPYATILAETIPYINYYRNTRKGFMRCCALNLFIWMVSHIEVVTPIFRNFWWFDQKPLKLFMSKEWENFSKDDWRMKLQELS